MCGAYAGFASIEEPDIVKVGAAQATHAHAM